MIQSSNDYELDLNSKRRTNSGATKRLSLRVGKITNVFPSTNTVNIQWLYPNNGVMSNLELTRPYVGFQSGIHFIPEVGSIVTVGFAEDSVILLSYSLPSPFSNMLLGTNNNAGIPTRIRKLGPGEISINSVQNAEIYVHDKIEFRDQFGDTIIINPKDGSINLNSLQFYSTNEAGTLAMGMVERNGKVITDDGQPVSTKNGGNALTEYKVVVNKLANSTINSSQVSNSPVATITVGTVIDSNGNYEYTQTGSKIVCEINFSSGALIQVDANGNFIMNQGNQITPQNSSIQQQAVQNGYSGVTYTNKSQQRAAREGDRIVIPITNGQTTVDPNHPDLENKATANSQNFTQLGSMYLCMGIPLTFIPSVPGAQIVGEITQGANGVYIGSLDKQAEQKETTNNLNS